MNSIDVEIFGGQYTIKGDADPEYVRQLARYVDDKMRMLSRKSPSSAPQKIAVLAALNIADELFKSKKRHREIEEMVRQKTGDLFDVLEEN